MIKVELSSYDYDKNNVIVLWDRKEQGRFPESKEVKQLVRDCVNPNKDLGHSDKDTKQISSSKDDLDKVGTNTNVKEVDCVECKENEENEQQTTTEKKKSNDQQPSWSKKFLFPQQKIYHCQRFPYKYS